jgi:hypothetical protein
MPSVTIEVVRYLGNEPQPGTVECELIDALGRTHRFVEKIAVVSGEPLVASSAYPRSETIACEIEERWTDEHGRNLVRVDTERPWGIESTDGMTRFIVLSSQVSMI